MNKIQVYLSLLVSALTFAACSQTDNLNSLSGKTGFLVSLTDPVTVTVSRATPQELGAAAENFQIKITRSATGEVVYDGGYTSDVIHAEAGFYELAAVCGENPALALDAPYYEGKVSAKEIKTNQVTAVSIPCKVANSLLSVKYNEEKKKFSDVYSNWYVEVKVESDTVHIQDTTKSAYFRAGSSFEVYFHAVKSGETEEKSIQIEGISTSLQAAEHLILTLSPEPDCYEIPLTVTKAEIKQVTVSETLPETWLPKPKLEAEGFTDNQLSFAETETPTAVIKLNTASALQDMKLKFHFEDEQFTSLNGDKTYVLSDEADKKAVEDALGITLPAVGSESASLDLSPLVARMQTNAGTTTANTIEVDVQANGRWSSEDESANRVYTLNCSRPEFHINVYPGNIWTKEFTVNALMEDQVEAGNFETLSQNMKYQFSSDGSTDWTDLGEDLRKADLQPGTTYYVRGAYRNEIYTDVVEVTTYPVIELENGNMESWAFEITDDSRTPITNNVDKVYWKKWFPWESTSVASIWNTVNQTTTQDGDSPSTFWGIPTPPYVGCCYVANSGTIPVEGTDAHNGKSALIKTVGWGSGSTGGGDASIIKQVTPGELYLGSYDLANHKPLYGIDYVSRPTSVKFWCKYEPKSTDLLIAKIVIMNKDEETIGEATLSDSESGAMDWTEKVLNIEYTDVLKAPAKMYILFKSGTLTDTGVMDKPGLTNLSDGESVGSKLYIDDISLVYDK